MNKKEGEEMILQMQFQDSIGKRKKRFRYVIFFLSSLSLSYAEEKLQQYSFDVSVALLYETLEERDGDVIISLVVVHRQSYDGSCTLSLKRGGIERWWFYY